MPYKMFPEGGKIAVYQVDESGAKVGKRRGLHADAKAAKAQMAAMMAGEKKAVKKELPNEGETVTLDTGTSHTVNLTDSIITKDYYEDEMPVMSYGPCSWDEMEAMESAHELTEAYYDMTGKMGAMANRIMQNPMIEDKGQALADLATGYVDRISSVKPEMNDKELAITKQIAGDNQPKQQSPTVDNPYETQPLFVWKEGDTYRWIAAYSNNRLDDEQEIISSASHKEFDEAIHKKEWPMPEAYLWHIPYPIGVTDYHAYDESTGFPVAAGHFYKDKEWAAEGVIKENWTGNSHGMPDNWIKYDPDNPKVIIRHRTKEITFLPLWAAANKLTFNIINKELTMSELEKGLPAHKRPDFVKAFGEERVKQIEDALADKSKEADEAGVVKKEETTPPAGVSHAEIAEVLKEIKTMFSTFNTRLDALEKSVVKEEDTYDLMAILKAKSIIGSEVAKIDGRSILAKDAPVETPNPQALGNHPVGLINNLFSANENWAAGRVR